MIFINGFVWVEHQIIVDSVDAFFSGRRVVVIMELPHGHVQIIQPSDEIIPEGSVPFSVGIHPFLIIVLLQFFQKVEQLVEIHMHKRSDFFGICDNGCWIDG